VLRESYICTSASRLAFILMPTSACEKNYTRTPGVFFRDIGSSVAAEIAASNVAGAQ
jgi:hypothetical protein